MECGKQLFKDASHRKRDADPGTGPLLRYVSPEVRGSGLLSGPAKLYLGFYNLVDRWGPGGPGKPRRLVFKTMVGEVKSAGYAIFLVVLNKEKSM